MTTLSTPLPLGGSGTIPTTVENSESSTAQSLGRLVLHLSLAAASLLVAIFLAFHGYIAWSLSHPKVAALSSNPKLAKNLDYSEVTFPSADRRTLVDGWWIPAIGSHKTVVLSHGYGANREEAWVPMYDLADLLHGLKYNVLMFDYGFANNKRPVPATGGRTESKQLVGALKFARQQGSEQLIVWGFSMGAGTALQAALQSEPIDAMILDSTFLPDDNTVYYNISQQVKLPKYPSVSLIRWFFPMMSGTRMEQIPSAKVQHTSFDFPILLIHGTADNKAPAYLSENVAKSQKNALSNLWVVPDAIHEMIFRTHPEEYVQRTTAFLKHVDEDFTAKNLSTEWVQI
ncbi:alpha/beta hydrolase [Cohnella kolymensis]|uniref:alpha/beta hydrolase n=1 Tax=Cohnella kolymensis TaxID=1590652 RepID=UPI000696F93B|nr:alpha/beta fold hydrolase [Cohnella kolymensis]